MNNFADGKYAKVGVPFSDERALLIWSGWEDYRKGLSYRADFDKLKRDDQLNYEAGRRVAAALKRHMRLPAWPPMMRFEQVVTEVPTDEAYADFALENALTKGVKSDAA